MDLFFKKKKKKISGKQSLKTNHLGLFKQKYFLENELFSKNYFP